MTTAMTEDDANNHRNSAATKRKADEITTADDAAALDPSGDEEQEAKKPAAIVTTTTTNDEQNDDESQAAKMMLDPTTKDPTIAASEAAETILQDPPPPIAQQDPPAETDANAAAAASLGVRIEQNDGEDVEMKDASASAELAAKPSAPTSQQQEEQEETVVVVPQKNNNEQEASSSKSPKDSGAEGSPKEPPQATVDTSTSASSAPAVQPVPDSTNAPEAAEAAPSPSLPDPKGVSVTTTTTAADTADTTNSPKASSSSDYSNLHWITVTNDGTADSMIKLVGLKSLFAKQLPKMPRAYIARLVFDRRHTSLAILSDQPAVKNSDEEIIGGICYRAFPEMRFAEIAFCAVNATHQVKGYGTKLMNLLKQMGARTGIEFFITYADNYAIGYFKKQGFTKNITMPKGRYFGLIKDYDGGTPMECYVHPSIDFTRVNDMIEAQRKFILGRVALTANSNKVVYPPLPPKFSPNLDGVSRSNLQAACAMTVPGILEAGWTMADLLQSTASAAAAGKGAGSEAAQKASSLKSELLAILRKIEEQQFAWPFREPVDPAEVPDYLDVITNPIDLKTMDKRIRIDNHYKSKQMLFADLQVMADNCKLYNEEGSTYTQCAKSLEKFVKGLMQDNAIPST